MSIRFSKSVVALPLALTLGLGCLKLVAELPPAAPQPSPAARPAYQPQRIEVFNDGVFTLSTDKPNPEKIKGANGERYLAEDEDVSQAQRARYRESCKDAPDGKSYTECFNRAKRKGIMENREKFNNPSGNLRSPWQGEDKRGKGLPKE